MCGIVGQVRFCGGQPAAERLMSGIAALAHRGPDDSTWWADGPFFFGHRRLSIIDLAQGRQPMASADGRYVITFNGEIYNYVELRDELASLGHAFRTHSDTEVLLHGYKHWGTDLPRHLKGMFAFAIADRVAHQLFVARDRFGEKPLLYHETSECVTFASELRPLAALATDRVVDGDALAGFLCLNYVPGDRTLLQGIRRVEPATWRMYGATGLQRTGRFWQPARVTASQPPVPATMDDALEQLQPLLDSAVRLTLRSDVPVGIFLSGGIDSSLVAESAARVGKLSHAFCLSMSEKGFSEWAGARQTADRLGIPITRVVLESSALDSFLDIVEHADDPLADSSAVAVYTLSREAARQNKVVIGGDGGDELFGGYLTYKASLWHRRMAATVPLWLRRTMAAVSESLPTRETKVSTSYKLWRFLRAAPLGSDVAHFTWNGTWLPADAAGLVTDRELKVRAQTALTRLADAHGLRARPDLFDLQAVDVTEYLPNDILAKSDRMSMAHGLEVRSPFLDPELADFALALPPHLKAGATGPLKRVLRELARRSIGAERASAAKQGFSIPVHQWLRGPGRDRLLDLLSPASVRRLDFLDEAAVERAVDLHMNRGRSLGFELWGLMVLVAWHRARIQRPQEQLADTSCARVDIPLTAPVAT